LLRFNAGVRGLSIAEYIRQNNLGFRPRQSPLAKARLRYGILRLKCLLNGGQNSPASIPRQGFACKSLQNGLYIFNVKPL
jgi:hypothetical protein